MIDDSLLARAYLMMGPWQHHAEPRPRAPYAAETWKRFSLAVPADWSGMASGTAAIVHLMTDGSVKYMAHRSGWVAAESVDAAQTAVDSLLIAAGFDLADGVATTKESTP